MVLDLSLILDQTSSLDLDLALLVNGVPVSFPCQPDLLCLLCPAALPHAPLVDSQRCTSMSICIVPKRLQSNKRAWQWQRIQQHGGVFRAVAQAGLISSCSSIQNYGSGGVSVASWCLIPLSVLLVSPCRIDIRVVKYTTLPLRYTAGGILYRKYCVT